MQELSGNRIELVKGHLITLRRVWTDYQKSRGRKLKESTIRGYQAKINQCFHDWLDLPVELISKDMVEIRHREISESNGPRGSGAALANLAMRILKALINYAVSKYEHLEGMQNPVKRLSEVRAWNRIKRRSGHLKNAQMADWYAAVCALPPTRRDYIIFLWLTGCRRAEAATLKWSDVDLVELTATFRATKNHDDHVLPLSSYLVDMLKERQRIATGPYVFPGPLKNTHFSLTNKDSEIVAKASGVEFTLHDLRRTVATTAARLQIEFVIVKRLLNHRLTDVTSGYMILTPSDLCKPMQKIADELMAAASQGRARSC